VRGNADVAGGIFGADRDFYRLQVQSSYDIPLKFESVLEFRIRTGIADAYGDSDRFPIFERFFAGGARTIRGYEERRVGPFDPVTEDPIGGESLLVGNIEYTIPVIEFIKLATFYDVGNVWADINDFGSGDYKSGAGLGVRVKTPIGPISVDYGYPLNDEPGEEERTGKFYFNVSRGF
jgi:outer membrane protein insertion porin family